MLPFKFFQSIDSSSVLDDYPGWTWTETDMMTKRVRRNHEIVDMNYFVESYSTHGIINFLRLFNPTDNVYIYSMECNGIRIFHDNDNQGWPWDITRELITFEAIIIPRERFFL